MKQQIVYLLLSILSLAVPTAGLKLRRSLGKSVCGDGSVAGGEKCDPGDPANNFPAVDCADSSQVCVNCKCEGLQEPPATTQATTTQAATTTTGGGGDGVTKTCSNKPAAICNSDTDCLFCSKGTITGVCTTKDDCNGNGVKCNQQGTCDPSTTASTTTSAAGTSTSIVTTQASTTTGGGGEGACGDGTNTLVEVGTGSVNARTQWNGEYDDFNGFDFTTVSAGDKVDFKVP